MRRASVQRLYRFAGDESGQAMPVIAFMLIALLAMCGLSVDVGHVFFLHRQLQAATDAAALAGAGDLPNSTAISTATTYSAVSGKLNARASLNGATMVSGYPKVLCLNTLKSQGLPCGSPANGNAMVVKEQITVNLIFLQLIGFKTLTIGASSTSAAGGGSPQPYSIAIILDASLSMNQYDSDCGATQMVCALNGVQVLLQNLYPCPATQTTCTISNGYSTNSVDRVALFTFPNITVGTASVNTNCTSAITASAASSNGYYKSPDGSYYYSMRPQTAWSGLATATGYSYPSTNATSYAPSGSSTPTYEVTDFMSDYKTSDTATSLNQNASIVQGAGGASNCGGLAPPNYDGDYGTYYAGAIYAAQAGLVHQTALHPTSPNVIILLSDGDATSPQSFSNGNGTTVTAMPSPADSSGNYPSYKNECAQGVAAANAATSAGTRVYTIAYGASTSGCSTDSPAISPCQAMANMASAAQYFYSDYNQSGSTGNPCYATAQSVTSLSDIFKSIAGGLRVPKLIPDNTT